MTWQPRPLPDHLTMRGGDPKLVGAELLSIITDAIDNHPRSLQTRIGPSEIGHPCARRLGYKLLNAPTLNPRTNWKAFVGTAMHEKLQTVIDQWNLDHATSVPGWEGEERFYTEQRVTAGAVLGTDIDGSTDVYDRVTATVIDWKLVGPTQLKAYRRNGPGETYRVQGHSYGAGWVRAGLPVDHVMVVFLPRNGELHDAYVWTEPFDPTVAPAAFSRVNGIATATSTLGPAALAVLPTTDAYCTFCDYYVPGSTDLVKGCPGDPAGRARFGQQTPALTMGGTPHQEGITP